MLDNLDDIESDLSAFHRIDDYREMHSARFFQLAFRIPAYKGVVRARIEAAEARKHSNGTPQANRESTVDYHDPSVAQYFDEG